MAIFPKIQSPCPYKGDLSAIMDGDVCRLCERQVFDLTAMSDGERVAFMKGCAGEVCVSYRLPLRPALVAAAIAAAAIAVPTAAAACSDATEVEVLIMGGIKDPANVQYVKDVSSDAVPTLPVVYEGGQAPQASQSAADGNKTAPVSSRAGS
jgi:poly(3-hydroxybutyrate) depolymerase